MLSGKATIAPVAGVIFDTTAPSKAESLSMALENVSVAEVELCGSPADSDTTLTEPLDVLAGQLVKSTALTKSFTFISNGLAPLSRPVTWRFSAIVLPTRPGLSPWNPTILTGDPS